MNDNTAKMIEQLAQKLGTTSEYLWKVLLRQAPIEATINLVAFILVIIFGYFLWKIHKKMMIKYSADGFLSNAYHKYEEGAIVPMVVATIFFMILFIMCLCFIGDTINGYFNPEYWALDKVLSKLK